MNEFREIIRCNLVSLNEELPPIINLILDHLYGKRVFGNHVLYEFLDTPSTLDRTRALLTFLPKRGPKAFNNFLDALEAADRTDISVKLKKGKSCV